MFLQVGCLMSLSWERSRKPPSQTALALCKQADYPREDCATVKLSCRSTGVPKDTKPLENCSVLLADLPGGA